MDAKDQNGSDRGVRALRQLVEQMRAEKPPALDWKRIERRVQHQLAEEGIIRPAAESRWQRRSFWRHAALLAAAAAVALFALGRGALEGREPPAGPVAAVDLNRLPTIEGGSDYRVDAVEPGALVESGARAVSFALAGVARWTLSPGTAVRVLTKQVPHVLRLERGSVLAEVVPRAGAGASGRFAVEVGSARVVVRGTVFSVSREGDEIRVEVRRGQVAVEPMGEASTGQAHLLAAPARASFSLQGQLLAKREPDRGGKAVAAAPQEAPGAEPGEPRPAAEGAAGARSLLAPAGPLGGAGPSPTSPAAPASPADTGPSSDLLAPDAGAASPSGPAPATISPADARELVTSCLHARSGSSRQGAEVHVSVRSHVRVRLDDDGRVSSVAFSPPLKPDLQACGLALFGRRVVPGASQFEFEVSFSP
ncbi:MAG: FecR domain-containing protein [Deltaproteobacteria bacterium]|nr:FecR domain-containing protein [Deltaproteobacteria bacterium]